MRDETPDSAAEAAPVVTRDEQLLSLAKNIGDDWKGGQYYERAERAIDLQWQVLIWPLIKDCDFSTVVELGAGHGRNTELLLRRSGRMFAVDINQENIDFLAKRFKDDSRVVLIRNNGIDLAGIPDQSTTFVYSFDSMVHFDSDIVRAYLKEFHRVLVPGGFGFCHYSNNTKSPIGSYRDHPAWRNFMSKELFEHYAFKEGLKPINSEMIDWLNDGSYCDAITLFKKRQ